MPSNTTVTGDKTHAVNCSRNETVLSALRRHGITIRAFCNGRGNCGKCRVKVDHPDIDTASAYELKLLSDEDIKAGIRLACFAVAVADIDKLMVTVIDDPDNGAAILTDTGILEQKLSDLNPSDLFNPDLTNLLSAENTGIYSPDIFAAFDLGTTTIAAKLVRDGVTEYTGTRLNSQSGYGADVISRSEASINGHGDKLAECIRHDIDSLLDEFPYKPARLIFSGNTTIIHLLMGYPLDEMVHFPFRPYFTGWIKDTYTTASGSLIPMYIIPAQSAYIGGDIVSGLYYCDFASSDKVSAFVDLGTNGEMAVGNRDRILTASAAAGPAFEGTRINVATDVVKCIAYLKEYRIIDENGLLRDPYFDSGYAYDLGNGEHVVITQKDIRDIQMAKSAIRAGLEILMERYGVNPSDIDRLYLAGGMGYSLDIDAALSIGLFDERLKYKAIPAGNTSLAGCIKYGSSGLDEAIDSILASSTEIILSNEPDFPAKYYEYMTF
ncbi:MAG: ASKHA domain-containing protein [Lachnospiraceae bacterium]|nr:ASKHA domain-containing protein [Lachnospiraceae bacterium]